MLVTEDGVGEFLSIAGRAAIIHHQSGPPAPGIHLVVELKGRPLLTVRAAMDADDERIRCIGLEDGRLGQKRLNLVRVIMAYEPEAFNLS